MKKTFLAVAAALLGAGLAQTSCQAPAPPAPKSEPVTAGNYTHQFMGRKPEPAKPTTQLAAQRKLVARPAVRGVIYGPSRMFIEKPHLRKVKYGRHRWVMV